jgi:hypothetical protein
MTGLLRHKQLRRPVTLGFCAISVQNLSGALPTNAARPVVVALHRVVNQRPGASEERATFSGRRHECCDVEEVADPLKAGDD